MRDPDISFAYEIDKPLDFAAAHADDALLDDLGSARPAPDHDGDEVALMLLGWRDAVDASAIDIHDDHMVIRQIVAGWREHWCA